MSPEHQRLAKLLEESSLQYGGRTKLARALRISVTALGYLIIGKRFVTMEQAAKIEVVLGVSARSLMIEAQTNRIDEDLPDILARVRKEFGK